MLGNPQHRPKKKAQIRRSISHAPHSKLHRTFLSPIRTFLLPSPVSRLSSLVSRPVSLSRPSRRYQSRCNNLITNTHMYILPKANQYPVSYRLEQWSSGAGFQISDLLHVRPRPGIRSTASRVPCVGRAAWTGRKKLVEDGSRSSRRETSRVRGSLPHGSAYTYHRREKMHREKMT